MLLDRPLPFAVFCALRFNAISPLCFNWRPSFEKWPCLQLAAWISALSPVPFIARSEEPGAEGVAVVSSPGVLTCELLELTRDIAVVPFFEGVDGGGGSRDVPVASDGRGLLTDIESCIVSDVFSDPVAGRFFACDGGASELTDRSCR